VASERSECRVGWKDTYYFDFSFKFTINMKRIEYTISPIENLIRWSIIPPCWAYEPVTTINNTINPSRYACLYLVNLFIKLNILFLNQFYIQFKLCKYFCIKCLGAQFYLTYAIKRSFRKAKISPKGGATEGSGVLIAVGRPEGLRRQNL